MIDSKHRWNVKINFKEYQFNNLINYIVYIYIFIYLYIIYLYIYIFQSRENDKFYVNEYIHMEYSKSHIRIISMHKDRRAEIWWNMKYWNIWNIYKYMVS